MYKLNDIFRKDAEYSARAEFCNNNGLMIAEIEPDENGRRFQIQEPPKPTAQELAEQEIWELKQQLSDLDYKTMKYIEGALSEEEFNQVKSLKQSLRNRIQELEV